MRIKILIALIALSGCIEPIPDTTPAKIDLGAAYADDSGFDANNPVQGAWDGVTDGSQSSYPGTQDSGSVWIRWDLGSVYDLHDARIYPDLNGTWITSRYSIQVHDGSTWQTVAVNEGVEERWLMHGIDIDARHVRLVVESDTGSTQFREFELYGTDTGANGEPLAPASEPTGRDLYASPSGGGDCFSTPCSLQEAIDAASAGDAISLETGTYVTSDVITARNNGNSTAPITLLANGALIDAKNIDRSRWAAVRITASHWEIYDLKVTNSPAYGIHLSNGASNNLLSRCETYGNDGTGVSLEHLGTEGNVIEHCDSYENYDPATHGQNADGFGVKNGAGNTTFRYDRAWHNADDGWDFWEHGRANLIEHSLAWGNGFNRWNDPAFEGNGNGFKLGGSDEGIPTGGNVLRHTIAYSNARWGYNDNNGEVGNDITHATAWNHSERNYQLHKGPHVLDTSISADGRDLFSDLTILGDNLLGVTSDVFVSTDPNSDDFLVSRQEGYGAGAIIEPANERVGASLFVTPDELAVWRDRAVNGPFRSTGDHHTNSPGDWDRIVSNANELQTGHKWVLDSSWIDSNGCVGPDSSHGFQSPESNPGIYTRDAAFYALVEQDSTMAKRAKSALLAQAREPSMDFTNTNLWCHDTMRDINPNFQIAIDVAHRVLAYDYLNAYDPTLFTESERAELEAWFEAYGELAMSDARQTIRDRVFVDPDNGDYTFRSGFSNDPRAYAYDEGPQVPTVAYWYNNRRNGLIRTAGMTGLITERQDLVDLAARHCKEWVMFSVFPEGFVGEFERATEGLPDLGWAYSMKTVGPCLTLADTMARTGDTSLYEFQTTSGKANSIGAPTRFDEQKSLFFALRSLLAYEVDEYERYLPGYGAQADYRIDSVDPRSGSDWHGPYKVIAYPYNLYYEDAQVADIALSRHPNTKGLPPYSKGSTNEHASSKKYEGEWGVYPGVLFQFGELEGQVTYP